MIDKWSAREVQEVLDKYHLEKGLRSTGRNRQISMNQVDVSPNTPLVSDIPEQKPAMFPVSPTWPLKGGETSSSTFSAGKLNDLHTGEDSADQVSEPPTLDLTDINDYETLCHAYSSVMPSQKTLIVQGL